MTLNKLYLSTYRTISAIALLSLATIIVCYGVTLLFFLVNHTWIAPTIVNGSSEKALAFNSELIRQQQTLDAVNIGIDALRQELVAGEETHKNLVELINKTKQATAYQATVNRIDAEQKIELGKQSTQNAKNAKELQKQLEDLHSVENNLNAGLITKMDAAAVQVNITQLQLALTGSEINNQVLQIAADNSASASKTLTGKAASSLDALSFMSKALDMQTQLYALDVQILSQKSELTAAIQQKKEIESAMTSLNNSPYADVIKHGELVVGFLPYDNMDNVTVGAPLYDCYLLFVACHKVGTVEKIYTVENIVEFPIFNTRFSRTLRGTSAEIKLDNKHSARSIVLFVGYKPLGF